MNDDASESHSETNHDTIMIEQERNNRLANDAEKDDEIKLLKAKLKLMEEHNIHLEISSKKEEKKSQDLEAQEIDSNEETEQRLKQLQDSLSGKTNEVDQLKEQLDLQRREHRTCKKELNATKNQLYYKHLALDGVIKSNIKLQEQLVVEQQKEKVMEKSASQTAVCLKTDGVDFSFSKNVSGDKSNVAVTATARRNDASKKRNKRRRNKKRFD